MFRKLGDAFRRFMYGRYGTDALNRTLLIVSVVLLLLSMVGSRFLPGLSVLGYVAYVPLVWSIVRMYSRNIEKRRRENAAYQRLLMRIKDRNNRYFRCPRCRQTVRVPRGKGKINIRCPKCSERFIKTT